MVVSFGTETRGDRSPRAALARRKNIFLYHRAFFPEDTRARSISRRTISSASAVRPARSSHRSSSALSTRRRRPHRRAPSNLGASPPRPRTPPPRLTTPPSPRRLPGTSPWRRLRWRARRRRWTPSPRIEPPIRASRARPLPTRPDDPGTATASRTPRAWTRGTRDPRNPPTRDAR